MLFQESLIAQQEDTYSAIKGDDTYFVTARHIEARGIGYKRGYFTLDGMYFPYRKGDAWPVLDVRGHVFTNNEYAANGGVGVRHFFQSYESALGMNLFYDYRSDHHRSLHFHQLGAGLEWIAKAFEVRLNGYFPINRKRLIQNCFFDDYIGDFFMERKRYKTALTGCNLEGGVHLCRNEFNDFYIAAGPYYYDRDCKEIIGGKFRLEMHLYGYVTLEGSVSYDDIFKGRVQGQLAITYPKRTCKKGVMTRPIHRHEIIVLDEFCKWRKNF